MLVLGGIHCLSDAQFDRWCRLLGRLRDLETARPGAYVFHGTSQAAAGQIIREGFQSAYVPTGIPEIDAVSGGRGIYWGRLDWAAKFAERNCRDRTTGFPAILVARLDAVVAAGLPCADLIALDDAGIACGTSMSWRNSFDLVGAFVVRDCRRVDGLSLALPADPGEVMAVGDDDIAAQYRSMTSGRYTRRLEALHPTVPDGAKTAPCPSGPSM